MNALLLRVVLLLVVLVAAVAVGLVVRARAGRSRTVVDGEILTTGDLGAPLGERATFVQFSSPACSPCRAVRRVLGEVAAADPAIAHLDIDATEQLDLTRRLGILRTPTVLVLDPRGQVVRRFSGVVTAEQAHVALPGLAAASK